jgi:hypothetical protein
MSYDHTKYYFIGLNVVFPSQVSQIYNFNLLNFNCVILTPEFQLCDFGPPNLFTFAFASPS